MEQALTTLRTTVQNGVTLHPDFRIRLLRDLSAAIVAMESEIFAALHRDLGKSAVDSYASEVGFVLAEIRHAIANLKQWAKPRAVHTPFFLKPAMSFVVHEPKGVILVLGAWNYPFQLCLAPLVAALAAGNTVVVKPSEIAGATAAVIAKLIKTSLPEHVGHCVLGGADVAQSLVAQKFDHIFFTGSTPVGRLVMRAAAEHLTPLTLELGGKSPCIVDRKVNVEVAAKRIVWGKFYNAGQTCIAPDYLLVHRDIRADLLAAMQRHIARFYGEDSQASPHFGRIVNESHFERLVSLLSGAKILSGGRYDATDRYIEPTLLDPDGLSAPVMQQEIFGPLLPVLTYDDLGEAIAIVRSLPTPLACYVFSDDKSVQREVISKLRFGGGCINQSLLHIANPHLPFGGAGASGYGRYHGEAGFKALSNQKSILADTLRFDLSLKYPPYRGGLRLLKMIFR